MKVRNEFPLTSESDVSRSAAYRKALGSVAVGLLTGGLIGMGLGNAPLAIAEHRPAQYPALSQDVERTAETILNDDYTIACEDIAPTVSPTIDASKYKVLGYVAPGLVIPYIHVFPSKRMHIDQSVCQTIASIDVESSLRPTLSVNQVVALKTVVHEQEHTRGTLDEAVADCTATQELAGRLLAAGYDKDALAQLRPTFLDDASQMPVQYQSAECRVGGALDQTGRVAYADSSLIAQG